MSLYVASYIAKRANTSQIKSKTNGAGIGVVASELYVNFGAGAQLVLDAGVSGGMLPVIAGLSVQELAFGGFFHRSIFTLLNVPLTLLDATVGLGTLFYTFPKGLLTVLGAAGQVAEITTSVLASTLNASVTYNWGLGTTTQANGTLATTEQDLLPTTNGTASATINVAGAASKGIRASAPALFDGHATAKSLFFNVGIATATDIDADATTTWTGSFTIDWMINQAGN